MTSIRSTSQRECGHSVSHCTFLALLHLHSTDLDVLVDDVVASEQLISEKRKPQLKALLEKVCGTVPCSDGVWCGHNSGFSQLQAKQLEHDGQDFYLYKILRAHILPLTNCAFNKAGDKCVGCGVSSVRVGQ